MHERKLNTPVNAKNKEVKYLYIYNASNHSKNRKREKKSFNPKPLTYALP